MKTSARYSLHPIFYHDTVDTESKLQYYHGIILADSLSKMLVLQRVQSRHVVSCIYVRTHRNWGVRRWVIYILYVLNTNCCFTRSDPTPYLEYSVLSMLSYVSCANKHKLCVLIGRLWEKRLISHDPDSPLIWRYKESILSVTQNINTRGFTSEFREVFYQSGIFCSYILSSRRKLRNRIFVST